MYGMSEYLLIMHELEKAYLVRGDREANRHGPDGRPPVANRKHGRRRARRR